MAGPYRLGPTQEQDGIPTWAWPRNTVVSVDCTAGGFIEMTAGGSPGETDSVNPGHNEFSRGFGGVLLAVKNLTSDYITVTTA
jgi:hypothetical protein